MQKIISAFVVLFLLSGGAKSQTLYQVELIAFARNTAEADTEENWDRPYNLRYPDRAIALQAADGSTSTFQQLPTEALLLKREADALAARRGWRVLLHTAWRQTADEPARATAVILAGGKQFGIHHELEGTFTLSLERFLRADANVWLSRFGSDATASSTTALPNPPGVIATDSDSAHFAPTQVVLLKEQRRMRSGELHYFDHPRFGLIVQVTPVSGAQ